MTFSVLGTTLAAISLSMSSQWWLTFGVIVLMFGALTALLYTTRVGVIARATTKEAIRQPVFLLTIAVALFLTVLNTFLPFFSFGDDIQMLKDCGLATILISGMLMAIWTASTSISDEIEGKTAMTLLSKPINRRQFVLGKYLGILVANLWLLLPLVIVFLFCIAYKVGYDARESGVAEAGAKDWFTTGPMNFPYWLAPRRMNAVTQIIPGVILIFLETAILTAISVAISTRMPMIFNMVACFTVFVIGHLTPVLVKAKGTLEFVKFMAQLIATVLPALGNFNTQNAIATGAIVSPNYLGMAAVYTLTYCTATILLAFILFEDRDLA
ncbi:conserved hypothetical protein-putative membrane bound transporter [hydrothermal vent metagenome]|uniref:ABC transporter, permease protein n=1 Tax=hydrothermal vent metagenome TaxID=652676 RepID=A0A3B1DU66_9ZZZZ